MNSTELESIPSRPSGLSGSYQSTVGDYLMKEVDAVSTLGKCTTKLLSLCCINPLRTFVGVAAN
jgi:hypothetical protein